MLKSGVYLCVRSRCSAEGEKEEKKKVVQETRVLVYERNHTHTQKKKRNEMKQEPFKRQQQAVYTVAVTATEQ